MKIKEQSEKMGLQLNIKKTKVMTTGKATNFAVDREDVEMVDSFCLLGSIINNKELKKYNTDWHLAEQG